MVVLAQTVIDACGTDPGFVCRQAYDWLGGDFWPPVIEWALHKPLMAVIIFIVAWLITRVLRRAIAAFVARAVQRVERAQADDTVLLDGGTSGVERRSQRAATLGTVLKSLVTFVVYLMAGLVALAEFDVDLAPLVAGAGIAGIALGFGAQSIVRDFLAGFFMIVEDQYGVGDIINFGEATGMVEAVSLRTTRLRDVEGTVWFVPNGEILRVANKSQLWARAVMDVEVAYDTDLQRAAAIIKSVADEVWREQLDAATIIEEPEIWGVENFGPNAVAIRLVIKTEPGEQFVAAREIRGRLKAAFDREGIEIPFPQRTIWLRREAETVPGGVVHAAPPPPEEG